MDKNKKIYIALLSGITVLMCALFFFIAFRVGSAKSAKDMLSNEISELAKNTVQVKTNINEIEEQIRDIDTELSSKNTVNNYYMEYKKTHDSLSSEVENLRSEADKLDGEITEKQSKLDKLSLLRDRKKGKSYNLKANTSYSCPTNFPAGRYTITGGATFAVTSAGSERLSENLAATGGTYTFDINDKDNIKVTADAVLTELK